MIPKIIHYCWFGDASIPTEYVTYIDNWAIKMPDYKLMFWHESNIPFKYRYIHNALTNNQYANASNLVRFLVLYEHGGVYLDTDMEVVKPFDSLLEYDFFCGEEPNEGRHLANTAILGSIPRHPILRECIIQSFKQFSGLEQSNLSAPVLITQQLRKHLLTHGDSDNTIGIFPREYFYPYGWKEELSDAIFTANTYTIHHWSKTWKTPRHKPLFFKRPFIFAVKLFHSFSRAMNRFKQRKAEREQLALLDIFQDLFNIASQFGNTQIMLTDRENPSLVALIRNANTDIRALPEFDTNKICVMPLNYDSSRPNHIKIIDSLDVSKDVIFTIINQHTPFSVSTNPDEFGVLDIRKVIIERGWNLMTFQHPEKDEYDGEPNHVLIACGIPKTEQKHTY